jgi:hypothetical protein
MFVCNNCKQEFEDSMKVASNKWCRPCRADYLKEWRAKNPAYTKERNERYRIEHAEELKTYNAEYRARPENAEKARMRTRVWYCENTDRAKSWEATNRSKRQAQSNARHKERMKSDPVYAARHRAAVRKTRAERRAREASALAVYYNDELKQIYLNCPTGHEVDHIHPLLGENFSGLHVPWNLQYLPMKENRRKSNKLRSAE